MTTRTRDDHEPSPVEFHDRLVNRRKNNSPKKPTTPAMMTAITINCTSPLRIWVSSWPSTASISWSFSAFRSPVVTVMEYCRRFSPLANAFSAGLSMIFSFGIGMPREMQRFSRQIIEPRLLLPRHGFAAGDGVDHVLVEEIGDHDPQRGDAGRIGKGRDQVAQAARR